MYILRICWGHSIGPVLVPSLMLPNKSQAVSPRLAGDIASLPRYPIMNGTPISADRLTHRQHQTSTSENGLPPPVEPIAIIGMGMRLPGGVRDAPGFWDLLVNGKSGRCLVPGDRYSLETWYGPGRALHTGTRHGYFLADDVDLTKSIDSSFWSLSKQEAEIMDPQQRLLLEVVYEALESSGAAGRWRGDDVGVYVGTMGDEWTRLEMQDGQYLDPLRADVVGDYIMANRVSYEFDLKGPRYVRRQH